MFYFPSSKIHLAGEKKNDKVFITLSIASCYTIGCTGRTRFHKEKKEALKFGVGAIMKDSVENILTSNKNVLHTLEKKKKKK